MIRRTRAPARLRTTVATTLLAVSTLVCLAGSAGATEFPCSEAGLDDAIAAAQGGDPGPHSLSCTSNDVIQLHGGRSISDQMILDLGGVTLECIEELPDHPCTHILTLGRLGCCFQLPRELDCGPPPEHQEWSHFRTDGAVQVAYAIVTLRNVTIPPPDDPLDDSTGIYVSNAGVSCQNNLPFGSLGLYDSTVSRNGDAVYASGGVVINRSTLSAKLPTAVGLVGGIFVTVSDSTVEEMKIVYGNVVNSTITARSPDRPAYVESYCGTEAAITNTIIDGACVIGNDTCPNRSLRSNGGNVEVGGNTCFPDSIDPSDQMDVTPEELALGPLADNGGPTLTRALGEGSVAIDAGVLDACPDVDQRGVPRPAGAGCDVGAFEVPEPDAWLLAAVALALAAALRRAARLRRRLA